MTMFTNALLSGYAVGVFAGSADTTLRTQSVETCKLLYDWLQLFGNACPAGYKDWYCSTQGILNQVNAPARRNIACHGQSPGWICHSMTGSREGTAEHSECTTWKNTCQNIGEAEGGTNDPEFTDLVTDHIGRNSAVHNGKVSAIGCMAKQKQFWDGTDSFTFDLWVSGQLVTQGPKKACSSFIGRNRTHCMNAKNALWKQSGAVAYFRNEADKALGIGLRAIDGVGVASEETWYVNTDGNFEYAAEIEATATGHSTADETIIVYFDTP